VSPEIRISQRRFPLLTVFGLGHLPASGTWGSIPPVLVAGAAIALGITPQGSPILYHLILVVMLVLFSGACVVQGDLSEIRFGKKDPKQVVADEVAGQSIALMALPIGPETGPWTVVALLLAAFFAFRAFDIAKFWPMSALQHIRGGWGILLDDLVAGVLALATVLIAAAVLM